MPANSSRHMAARPEGAYCNAAACSWSHCYAPGDGMQRSKGGWLTPAANACLWQTPVQLLSPLPHPSGIREH